jgi:hypothetical protein
MTLRFVFAGQTDTRGCGCRKGGCLSESKKTRNNCRCALSGGCTNSCKCKGTCLNGVNSTQAHFGVVRKVYSAGYVSYSDPNRAKDIDDQDLANNSDEDDDSDGGGEPNLDQLSEGSDSSVEDE